MPTKAWRAAHVEQVREQRRRWYANHSEHAKRKVLARRAELREWFAAYKTTLRCERCEEDHPACLDFHHEDPSAKEVIVSKVVERGWSKARILREIEKCIILCANCHRKEHWNRARSG